MNYLLLAVLLLPVNIAAQNYKTGDNTTVQGCSSHCAFEDDTLECWNKTLQFFERILLGQMRHFIAVQINIDQWHRRHDHVYVNDFNRTIAESNKAMQAYITSDDLIDSQTVNTVVRTLIYRVGQQSDKKISWVPHYNCPLPCEYKYSVWRNLFIVSAILNACLMVVVIPFIRRMSRKREPVTLISD